jgi:hypothetical protein
VFVGLDVFELYAVVLDLSEATYHYDVLFAVDPVGQLSG